MKNTEVVELSNSDLLDKLDELKSLYVKTKLNHAVSPIENPMKIRYMRKDIARIKTEIRKRQLNGQL